MQVVAGLLALACAIAWIAYLAVSVLTLSDPSADRLAAWGGLTPVMALAIAGSLWVVDRYGHAG